MRFLVSNRTAADEDSQKTVGQGREAWFLAVAVLNTIRECQWQVQSYLTYESSYDIFQLHDLIHGECGVCTGPACIPGPSPTGSAHSPEECSISRDVSVHHTTSHSHALTVPVQRVFAAIDI